MTDFNYDMTVRQMLLGTIIEMIVDDVEALTDDQDEDQSDQIEVMEQIKIKMQGAYMANTMPELNDPMQGVLQGLFSDKFEDYGVQDIDDAEYWGDVNAAFRMMTDHYKWEV